MQYTCTSLFCLWVVQLGAVREEGGGEDERGQRSEEEQAFHRLSALRYTSSSPDSLLCKKSTCSKPFLAPLYMHIIHIASGKISNLLVGVMSRAAWNVSRTCNSPFHSLTQPSSPEEANIVPVTFHATLHTCAPWWSKWAGWRMSSLVHWCASVLLKHMKQEQQHRTPLVKCLDFRG